MSKILVVYFSRTTAQAASAPTNIMPAMALTIDARFIKCSRNREPMRFRTVGSIIHGLVSVVIPRHHSHRVHAVLRSQAARAPSAAQRYVLLQYSPASRRHPIPGRQTVPPNLPAARSHPALALPTHPVNFPPLTHRRTE